MMINVSHEGLSSSLLQELRLAVIFKCLSFHSFTYEKCIWMINMTKLCLILMKVVALDENELPMVKQLHHSSVFKYHWWLMKQ